MALYDRYLKTVYTHTRYRATWAPGAPIVLGQVGRIVDGMFMHLTDLQTLGIPFETAIDAVPSDQFSFQSKGVKSIVVKAAGALDDRFQHVAEAKAGIKVSFSSGNAVVVKTADVRVNRIKNAAQLEADLLAAVLPRLEDGQMKPPVWQRDWVVVTEVIDAGAATILASIDKDAALELEASAAVGPQGLVDVDAGLAPKWSSSIGLDVVAGRGLTPFYRAVRVKRKWWWLWDDRVVTAGSTPPEDPADVFEPDISDLVDESEPTDD